MEPTITQADHCRRNDEQFWGTRPIAWGLRMLEPDLRSAFESFSSGECREVAAFLGLTCPNDDDRHSTSERLAVAAADRRRALATVDTESVLYKNLQQLRLALGLNEVDLDLIAFRALLRLHPGFEVMAGKYIGLCAEFVFHRKLERLFDVPDGCVAEALAPSAKLVKNGLLEVLDNDGPLHRRLWTMRCLTGALMTPAESPDELLARMLPAKRNARLELSMYPHLAQEIVLLSSHLRATLAQQSHGTNVLLYGKPGTGKTELAAALVASLQRSLYVADPAPDDGGSLTPRDRIRQLIQLQKLVRATGRGIVLVDEAEDLFPTGWSDPEKVPSKAAVNECLEANPTPTIWISNRTEHLDEAFLRRFDLVIHIPPLPASAKCKLMLDLLPAGTLHERELRQFASHRELSPAMIARMARVAVSGNHGNPPAVRRNLYVMSSQYLRVLGADATSTWKPYPLLKYDPSLLNTDPALDTVMEGLVASRLGVRMLLHGAPGTGKTELGRMIAEKVDRPLLQHRASSLLSPLLGATECKLREMFNQARIEDGVLLLDEADSFLRSRDEARASWEVTQTNELLTQMEGFEGVFICTTNRLDALDPAALRRFDLKVEFKPLRPNQRWSLVEQCCRALGLRDVEKGDAILAPMLDGLTPGDASAALRRLRLSPGSITVHTVLDALADECRYKPCNPNPIGFLR